MGSSWAHGLFCMILSCHVLSQRKENEEGKAYQIYPHIILRVSDIPTTTKIKSNKFALPGLAPSTTARKTSQTNSINPLNSDLFPVRGVRDFWDTNF